MKNITLSADESVIEQARLVARARHKTLNAAFREWLEQYAAQAGGGGALGALIRRLRPVRSRGPHPRAEMNEGEVVFRHHHLHLYLPLPPPPPPQAHPPA